VTIVLVGLLVGLAFFCFDIVEERLHYWKQSAGMIVATCYACGRGIRQREHAFRYKHDYLCAKDMARKERIPISKDLRESPDYPYFDKQEDWRVCESFPPELLAEEPRVEKSFACRLSELVAYEIGFIHKASLGLNLHSAQTDNMGKCPTFFFSNGLQNLERWRRTMLYTGRERKAARDRSYSCGVCLRERI
jgi:hypothetical protein